MASDRSLPRHRNSANSIPLQDLPRPPDWQSAGESDRGHRRSLSSRSHSLLGNRQSFTGRVGTGRYHRVSDGSPPANARNEGGLPHVTTPRNTHQGHTIYDDEEESPVDPGDLAAMGQVGLSFDHLPLSAAPEPTFRPGRNSTLGVINETDTGPTLTNPFASPFSTRLERAASEEAVFSPMDNDTTPLTDSRFLQPIAGADENSAFRQNRSRSGSRLGDDLPGLENGMLRPNSMTSARSSISGASSPLTRMGTIMRNASQRVVNLSNEPEILESTLRRQPSARHARLEAPPSFPAHVDRPENDEDESPTEKRPPLVSVGTASKDWRRYPNPLRGRSLGVFGPDSWLRQKLCEALVHPVTEPTILILIIIQTILLAIDSAPRMEYMDKPKAWQKAWINYGLTILFMIYTLEIIAKIIVSGFIKNAGEYSSVNWDLGFRRAIIDKTVNMFVPQRPQSTTKRAEQKPTEFQPSLLKSFTGMQVPSDQPGHSRQQQRVRLARRAFLRHSFNRLDLVAIVSFWISSVLSFALVEGNRHVYVFRMLSCLRILRLLSLTTGTSVILRSLKRATPLLVNVAFLISFFWLLFAVIGVQCFKSSLKRSCVWISDIDNFRLDNGAERYYQNVAPGNFQPCGGHINSTTREPWPWLTAGYENGTDNHKGYLCPVGSICLENSNPYNGTVSFDNVIQSLQLVFVIMSSNTFSDLMYYTTDSDFLPAALFFAFGIVIMSLWLMNLLVAVITSSFQVIREESKASAFTAVDEPTPLTLEHETPVKVGSLKRLYDRTKWLWIIVIVFDLVVQSLRSASMGPSREAFINNVETIVTVTLVVEIALRFASDFRHFHRSKCNWLDLGLAIITAVIQIPHIRQSGQIYAWLTFFQILRIYRVVLAVSLTRDLIMIVLGNVSGLLNLIIFVFLITFLTAIFAVQIFRGELPAAFDNSTIRITFSDIYNSFIGMYQILSSENWTSLMYTATSFELRWDTAWIAAIFFILWFILANFIVLNMFIAVIQENFDVTEDQKLIQQVKAFIQQRDLGVSTHSNLSLSAIFKLGQNSERYKDPLDYGPANLDLLKDDEVIREFLDEQLEPMDDIDPHGRPQGSESSRPMQYGFLGRIQSRIISFMAGREPNPFYSKLQFSRRHAELDPRTMAKEVITATEVRKKAQRQYLTKYPNYNVSLYVFKPDNPLRRLCQRIVGPGRGGARIEGTHPYKPVWYAFSAFIYAAIVAMVLLACISTPLYQKQHFPDHLASVNWLVWTDLGFAALFSVEAIIKVIADGFFMTPNAYFRGSWGFIDGIVLITLWINVATMLRKDVDVSRAVGAFKALRALRLLNVSDNARDTFHSVIVLGGWKVVSAAFVSLSLLIPFAIYGLNLFNGQFQQCNDGGPNIVALSDCVGEYTNTPFKWDVLAPRQVSNPYYNFDDFGNSLFILFQIVSQEGWTDVMWSAMQAAGKGMQPQDYRSQGNAVFFIIFNLLGAVFVLTLFVSVFMRNYTEQTGVAFLTAEQRSWLELRKALRQISPSKRPSNTDGRKWRQWCYRVAVKKHGKWQRWLTFILTCHLILLLLEFYPNVTWWDETRDYIFLAFTLFYIANINIRIVGLTWKRFRNSSWDLYSIFSVSGTIVTTLLAKARPKDNIYVQLHKLFLVSIALLLIPRNNQLDQLFKTAAASLTAIANLLATWFVLFLVYAIALTQTFGLTKFGSGESGNLNFRNVPKALILLFRMSCGEGWNAIMEDFATMTYPNCVAGVDFYESDCGSATWARALFISWNIVSMYIFVSLFVSLIFESFSYVYQRSSDLSTVSREEIRRFKQAWATYDPDGTGYISMEVFPRLLGELSGVFEMRIYKDEHTVHRILEDCQVDVRGMESPPPGVIEGINLARLNERLDSINVEKIRQRRHRLEIFFQEVKVSANKDRGVNFTSCLMILAHHNIISDNKSLKLDEFLRRRARLVRVVEEVQRRVVRGFFDTMFWSRQFQSRLDFRHSARMTMVPQFAVPEIFVDDQDAPDSPTRFEDGQASQPLSPTSPRNSLRRVSSIQQQQQESQGRGRRPTLDTQGLRQRSPSRSIGGSSDRSYSISPQISPQRSPALTPHRPSHSGGSSARSFAGSGFPWLDDPSLSTGGGGASGSGLYPTRGDVSPETLGARSRAGSSVNKQDVLDVFDNSAWGESIRRSFTTRRQDERSRSTGGGGGGGASGDSR